MKPRKPFIEELLGEFLKGFIRGLSKKRRIHVKKIDPANIILTGVLAFIALILAGLVAITLRCGL